MTSSDIAVQVFERGESLCLQFMAPSKPVMLEMVVLRTLAYGYVLKMNAIYALSFGSHVE